MPHDPVDELLANQTGFRSLARRLVRDAASADDLLRGAALAALRRPPRIASRAWLARVVTNLARQTGRGDRHRSPAREDQARRRATDAARSIAILDAAGRELERREITLVPGEETVIR